MMIASWILERELLLATEQQRIYLNLLYVNYKSGWRHKLT